jgi:hypothetical protein
MITWPVAASRVNQKLVISFMIKKMAKLIMKRRGV